MNLSEQAGKYDDIAAAALMVTKADGVIVIVLNGEQGHGFSVAALGTENLKQLLSMFETILPEVLAHSKADAAKL